MPSGNRRERSCVDSTDNIQKKWTTLSDDGAVDTLFGRGGLDWFLVCLNDIIEDLNTGGTETTTPVP